MDSSNISKYLIIGATGGTGKELVDKLVSEGKKVAILVRNKTKAKSVLKDKYEKIDNVIEYELGLSAVRGEVERKYNSELLNAIEWCDVLISTVGNVRGSDPQTSDYFATVELLDHCQKSESKFKNKLFVLVTTLFITRPYHFISFILNWIMPYVLGWKALAENRVRQSGLNYLIVRPGGLTSREETKTVEVYQGDTVSGYISRKNLANMILYSITNSNVNKGQVTVDVIEKKKSGQSDTPVEITSFIKLDDENSIVTADHFRATRNITFVLYGILTLLVCYLVYRYK